MAHTTEPWHGANFDPLSTVQPNEGTVDLAAVQGASNDQVDVQVGSMFADALGLITTSKMVDDETLTYLEHNMDLAEQHARDLEVQAHASDQQVAGDLKRALNQVAGQNN